MKPGTLLIPNKTLPKPVQEAIEKHFPGIALSALSIHYYANVEDVGYEYFVNQVIPTCTDPSMVHYLAPFISFIRLGEALILDRNGLVIYDSDGDDEGTELGPFWVVFPQEMSILK